MDIGLNIAEGVRVRVGDTLESITKSMEEHSVEYEIAYVDERDDNTDMVIFMQKYGVELNLFNKRIIFIKSNNTAANYIMELADGMNPVIALTKIRQNLANDFNIKTSDVRIDRFDGSSLNSSLSIPVSKREKVKLELVMGANSKIYLHSIELVR